MTAKAQAIAALDDVARIPELAARLERVEAILKAMREREDAIARDLTAEIPRKGDDG